MHLYEFILLWNSGRGFCEGGKWLQVVGGAGYDLEWVDDAESWAGAIL